MKLCKKCKQELPLDAFWKCSSLPDGLQYNCIACSKQRWLERVTNNREVKARYREREKKYYAADVKRYLLRMAKKRAKALDREFTITVNDIELVETCPVFEWKLEMNTGKLNRNSYSLDRIDNEKGYIPGNVRVISWYANNLKSNLTVDEVERLYKYMKGT
jgi:hypothetical protein